MEQEPSKIKFNTNLVSTLDHSTIRAFSDFTQLFIFFHYVQAIQLVLQTIGAIDERMCLSKSTSAKEFHVHIDEIA